ncbi:hypothetical protein B0T16DRAFT_491107 [Cercophora newfieldiana]|uniref:Uncharacterized protein n=1 Tax=Cercophora newfieldiana TaxID=92897 RepID=A0AA40CRS2_9PEZI|nr:hypothetical protein B0T16DRAFT_491107 [Cercophora newfieldiana]
MASQAGSASGGLAAEPGGENRAEERTITAHDGERIITAIPTMTPIGNPGATDPDCLFYDGNPDAAQERDVWWALRVAATAAVIISAILVTVCLRMKDVGRVYQITATVATVTWILSFSAVFVILLRRQSTALRKKLYACFTFILTLHLLGFGLRVEQVCLGDGSACGPLAATASAFIMSVMFEAKLDIIAALQEA